MRIPYLPLITLFFIALYADTTMADVTLLIDPQTLCTGSKNNVIPLIQDNPDEAISGLQVDIYFNTEYFTVTSVERSSRSDIMDLFFYSTIRGGIRIAMTCCFHSTHAGTGPIANIIVDVKDDCPGGEYTWNLEDATAQSPSGQYPPLTMVDGTISVSDCESCSLLVPAAVFDLGDFFSGYSTSTTIDITNVGPSPGYVIIKEKGCVLADPTEFFLNPGLSQEVEIICRPYGLVSCKDTLTLIGCRDDIELTVQCNRLSGGVILIIQDQTVFQNSEKNTTTLDMENNLNVAALQCDVLFDTTCFDFVSARRTERTKGLGIFAGRKIEGGFRIAMSGEHGIESGGGPIVEILFSVINDCENQYVWNMTQTIAAEALGRELSVTETDGTITILSGQRGDVDNSGTFNILDVFWVLRIVLDELPNPTPRQLEAADCNDDGIVDVTDVIGIVNVILELGTCP